MSQRDVVRSPAGWSALTSGVAAGRVWTKPLPTQEGGDAFALLRLGPAASVAVRCSTDDRFLVLSGTAEFASGRRSAPARHRRGDYVAVADSRPATISTGDGAVMLWLSGPRLGDPAVDVLGPDDWQPSSPGQWFRLLLDVPADAAAAAGFDERMVGVAYMEPGSSSVRHPHRTPHRFLFLDGGARDELFFPDGRQETTDRSAGDFVDYPVDVEHQTSSERGCTVLFVHQALGEH